MKGALECPWVPSSSGSAAEGQCTGASSSLQDLCERHEKGVLHKHQRALHKDGLMKRQAVSNREPESVEQLESRILEVAEQAGRWQGQEAALRSTRWQPSTVRTLWSLWPLEPSS